MLGLRKFLTEKKAAKKFYHYRIAAKIERADVNDN